MNRKTRTLSCRSPVRTRPPLLPGSRAPDAAGGSHGADGPTQPAPPPEAHHHGGQHHVRLGAPNSRSLAPLARTRVTAPPAFGLIAPARPSGAEIPARMAGDSSASQHLLLKWKGVHETGSTPLVVPGLVGVAGFHRRDNMHQAGVVATDGEHLGDDVFLADVVLGNVFDGNASSTGELGSAGAHAITKRFG